MKPYSDWCGAGEDQHTAVAGGAGGISMLEHVASAVDAGTLAVPQGEDAVILSIGKEVGLLAAPHRGRRQILVDAREEADVVLLEEALGLPEVLVEAAQRRAAIAGDESRGVEPGGGVPLPLHHRQANQRLDAREIDTPLVERVFVVESDCRQRHGTPQKRLDL